MPTFKVFIGGDVVGDRALKAVLPALASAGLNPTVLPSRGDCHELTIDVPDPKPTIPELIARWQAEPTRVNRHALWAVLFSDGLIYGKGCYTYKSLLYAALPNNPVFLGCYCIAIG